VGDDFAAGLALQPRDLLGGVAVKTRDRPAQILIGAHGNPENPGRAVPVWVAFLLAVTQALD
jgi:hypothetical protein